MFWILGADELAGAMQPGHDGGVVRFFVRQFEHAEWEGFRFYDLIFPLFIFLVGVSIVFSLGKGAGNLVITLVALALALALARFLYRRKIFLRL